MTSLTDDSDVTTTDVKPVEAEASLPTASDTKATVENADLDSEFISPFRKVSRLRPIFGPSIWTFGALLWAYVVLGEYTTAGFIGEAIAGALLILVAAVSWTIAVRRSLATPPRRFGVLGRTLFPGAIALLLSIFCALFMNFVGESSHQNPDVPMTLAFMVLGMLAFFGGKRLTGSVDKQPLTKTYAHLPLIGAILVSLGAVLHLIVAN